MKWLHSLQDCQADQAACAETVAATPAGTTLQVPQERAQAEQMLRVFSTSTEYVAHCKVSPGGTSKSVCGLSTCNVPTPAGRDACPASHRPITPAAARVLTAPAWLCPVFCHHLVLSRAGGSPALPHALSHTTCHHFCRCCPLPVHLLQAILDSSSSPYAQLLASSSLIKVVTEHSMSTQVKLEMRTYFLNYLDRQDKSAACVASSAAVRQASDTKHPQQQQQQLLPSRRSIHVFKGAERACAAWLTVRDGRLSLLQAIR